VVKEFGEFLKRGNVIDLAVAVILGGAFGAIVNSLVKDLFMPLIGILIGGINFTGLVLKVGSAELMYGNFLQALVNFVLIALALFFVVKAYNTLKRKEKPAAPPPPPAKPEDVLLLAEIRDLLKKERG
jgi:large conductance mechanosensitive channel